MRLSVLYTLYYRKTQFVFLGGHYGFALPVAAVTQGTPEALESFLAQKTGTTVRY